MPEFPGWERLALLDRSDSRPKSRDVDISSVLESNTRVRAVREQEAQDRIKEVQEISFLSEEEKAALIGQILPNQAPTLLASADTDSTTDVPPIGTEWHEPFVEFAKEMLTPDWTDVVLLMATGPEWPAVKRAIKLPEALRKFIESFSKVLGKTGKGAIERSFEHFIQTGEKKWLEESITALRKSNIPEHHRIAEQIEGRMLDIEAKVVEARKVQALQQAETKAVDVIPKEPKVFEMSPDKLKRLANRTDEQYRNELERLMTGDPGSKKLPLDTAISKLRDFEEHLVYLKETKGFNAEQLRIVEERYMFVYNRFIKWYLKGESKLGSVKDAKEYLYPLKNK